MFIYDHYLFVYHVIFVCNIVNLIKCIVCEEINQYQIESPLVLSFKLEATSNQPVPEGTEIPLQRINSNHYTQYNTRLTHEKVHGPITQI